MRKTKFRFWNKLEKKMHEDVCCCSDDGDTNELIKNLQNNYILMQYTGLKDSKGVEIYELMELNNKYIVVYILTGYFLYDIINKNIRNIQEDIYDGFIPKITREYSPLSENQKRNINEYISASKVKKYC